MRDGHFDRARMNEMLIEPTAAPLATGATISTGVRGNGLFARSPTKKEGSTSSDATLPSSYYATRALVRMTGEGFRQYICTLSSPSALFVFFGGNAPSPRARRPRWTRCTRPASTYRLPPSSSPMSGAFLSAFASAKWPRREEEAKRPEELGEIAQSRAASRPGRPARSASPVGQPVRPLAKPTLMGRHVRALAGVYGPARARNVTLVHLQICLERATLAFGTKSGRSRGGESVARGHAGQGASGICIRNGNVSIQLSHLRHLEHAFLPTPSWPYASPPPPRAQITFSSERRIANLRRLRPSPPPPPH